ncbi:hypothetical protein [Mesorhizobium sp. M00.F.Ca.ET.216.01.1.1]|uniref:hypothetical protein n=1 Tax=Mesorhizobium sp. M00.F.Ca.ET.216.01.1.1 TaxID=2500528 RepID=UPI0032AEC200
MNFGSIDTLSGSQTNSTATISMNCLGLAGQRILICPISGPAREAHPRRPHVRC